MKTLNFGLLRKAVPALAMLVMLTAAGCGNDNNNGAPGAPGIGSVVGGSVPLPNGGQQVYFTGQTQLGMNGTGSDRIVVGRFVSTVGNYPSGCPSGMYCFVNRLFYTLSPRPYGPLAMDAMLFGRQWGTMTLGAGATGNQTTLRDKWYGPYDGITSVSAGVAMGGVYLGAPVQVSGMITLSPQFIQQELLGQPVTEVAGEFWLRSGVVVGGTVFIYTAGAQRSFVTF